MTMNQYRTTWYIFKRKKLIGYNLYEKYKDTCVCIYAPIVQERYSKLIFLRGELCGWVQVWERHVKEAERTHKNLPTLTVLQGDGPP